ncbi:MAG: helix-turn-helix transcriptional regulator [Arcobacteraceae bacterium]|nr:helix-turn-helix transcriptional regulator [Arcobacteraceae bacterium]
MKLYEIGQKVKNLRKEKGVTQENLASLSGISRVTLGKIEKGELGSVSVKTLDIILASLGYEIDINLNSGYGLPTL